MMLFVVPTPRSFAGEVQRRGADSYRDPSFTLKAAHMIVGVPCRSCEEFTSAQVGRIIPKRMRRFLRRYGV